jgi:iron complex transport system ATP-binding protein
LSFAYRGADPLLTGLSVEIHAGRLLALVGPNGAGKSTLLRLLSGLLAPTGGEILLDGRALTAWRPLERARRIALLPQHPQAPPDIRAGEVVRLGRHPYLGLRVFESARDLSVVGEAMRITATAEFASRQMGTLSGGEAQRVHLAAALAQQPAVLALDEPTSDLDLAQQLRIFELLRALTRQQQLAVITVTHDLNLASRFADTLCVLHNGRIVAAGPPADILRDPILTDVYGVHFQRFETGGGAPPLLVAHARATAMEDGP